MIVWKSLSPDLDRSAFDCGVEQLNVYFRNHAGQNHRSRLAICTVALSQRDSSIIGFYTFSASEVARDKFPPGALKGIPRYPVPVIRIGQLAVERSFQGDGMGKIILAHALRTVILNPVYGAVAVIVDSLSPHATEFYQRHGFTSISGDKPELLFIPIKTAAKALEGEA